MMNPYASHLADLEPVVVIEKTSARLNELACGMSPELLERPVGVGKWCPREILAHLADCEMSFGFRLRQTLAGVETIQPFDQTVWSERYAVYDVPGALALFSSARSWNLKLLATVTEADKARVTNHPERGAMTFWTIVETMAGHDINHLRQLESIELV